ncbi:MAG: YcxB family protein [Lachnospiraceae bacterium]|nr:YcxB family protein [Lachnospiraceae bacterium]
MESFKEVKFSVQMKTMYMFDFLYWHSYHGVTGIINYALSFAGIAALIAGFGKGNTLVTVMLVALSALFTVINPLSLLYKASRQVKKSPMFAKPLHYKFDTRGFSISQDNNSDSAEWNAVAFIRETGKSIILYLGAANALILPKTDIGEQLPDLKKLIRNALPQQAKKLKK